MEKSVSRFKEAQKVIAGGVNSPIRAMREMGVEPPFVSRGEGQFFWSVDEKRYLDLCMSWGALILGHAPKPVVDAVTKQITKGSTFGIPTESETALAKLITSMVPSMELVRFVNSGTEAAMSAIRLARGFTRRDIIVKFDGSYHGHSDSLLVSAGSGVSQLPSATSAGIPQEAIRSTISIPYNDIAAIRDLFSKMGSSIAAVIVEPIAGNMGVVVPDFEWLYELRKLTESHDSLLIFDEVITGFRLSPSGIQGLISIKPDITLLGKIVGGGFPAAALGGRADIMNNLAPEGSVYQAGTLSGNPVAMEAGIAMLSTVRDNPNIYKDMENTLEPFIWELKKREGVVVNHIGSMFTIFFSDSSVDRSSDLSKISKDKFRDLWMRCYNSGIYLSPSSCESLFISTAHTTDDLQRVLSHI